MLFVDWALVLKVHSVKYIVYNVMNAQFVCLIIPILKPKKNNQIQIWYFELKTKRPTIESNFILFLVFACDNQDYLQKIKKMKMSI